MTENDDQPPAPEPEAEPATDAVWKLTKDLKAAAKRLSAGEARYLVDRYYQVQNDRIRAGHQLKAAGDANEPNAILTWTFDTAWSIESAIKRALDLYSDAHAAGQWAKQQYGIGPVLSAGLIAHIDIERAPTVGHIWRFAGLDPTVQWAKGKTRPWNARLKTLCWKAGDSFVKFHAREECFYGKLYSQRKALEIERNVAGLNKATAAATLQEKKFDKTTKTYQAYQAGLLPDGRIDLRARRWAVKLFLAHLHHVMHWDRFGQAPPKPYVIEQLGHAHMIAPPGWPLELQAKPKAVRKKRAAVVENPVVNERTVTEDSTETSE